ncbi:MAG: CBS domain-containing protein, partial [Phycisphaerae bacterium]|nr:CBS domain-containing protein [Phycisphaerae bacterium]
VIFYLGLINTMLVVFNLIPGYPLDGGRVLRAYLWQRYGNVIRATAVAAQFGKVFGFVMMGFGLMVFVAGFAVGEGNFGGLWLIVIGLFLRKAAEASYRNVLVKETLSGLSVREVIQTNGISVTPDISLERVVEEYFYPYRRQNLPVVLSGALVGVISLTDLRKQPRQKWGDITVREAMRPTETDQQVRPEQDVAEALKLMLEEDQGHLPVVENGLLVGVISRDDIMAVLYANAAPGGG